VTVSLATLRATGAAGSDTLSGFENVVSGAGNDCLLGDANANILSGEAGNDTLSGGAGDDSLAGGAGTADWAIYAELTASSQAVTVSLATLRATGAAGSDTLSGFENVVSGAGNDSLTGDGVANMLVGLAGNDTLSGDVGDDTLDGGAGADLMLGGSGNDCLIGALGIDQFIFNTALGLGGVDTISGYSVTDDTIVLDDAIFAGIGAAGTSLAAGAFTIGAAATTSAHRIIYNNATGALFYDADGSGAGSVVQFATLAGVTGTITAAEFVII
jgi:serralysin